MLDLDLIFDHEGSELNFFFFTSIAAQLTNQGRKVTMVFETTDSFLAGPVDPPQGIRRSRQVNLPERVYHLPTIGQNAGHLVSPH